MNPDLDLSKLFHPEKDALILSLFAQLQAAVARIGELEKRLEALQSPPKTPDNSSVPPSKGHSRTGLKRPGARVRVRAAWGAQAVGGY